MALESNKKSPVGFNEVLAIGLGAAALLRIRRRRKQEKARAEAESNQADQSKQDGGAEDAEKA